MPQPKNGWLDLSFSWLTSPDILYLQQFQTSPFNIYMSGSDVSSTSIGMLPKVSPYNSSSLPAPGPEFISATPSGGILNTLSTQYYMNITGGLTDFNAIQIQQVPWYTPVSGDFSSTQGTETTLDDAVGAHILE